MGWGQFQPPCWPQKLSKSTPSIGLQELSEVTESSLGPIPQYGTWNGMLSATPRLSLITSLPDLGHLFQNLIILSGKKVFLMSNQNIPWPTLKSPICSPLSLPMWQKSGTDVLVAEEAVPMSAAQLLGHSEGLLSCFFLSVH